MELDLRQFFTIVRRWFWLLLIGAALGAAGGYTLSARNPPTYASRTRLIVGQTLERANTDYGALYASQRLAKTYSEIVTSYPVLSGVVSQLNLTIAPEVLAGAITSRTIEDTEFLDIMVTARSPEQAAAIANAVANQLIQTSPTGPNSSEAQVLKEVQAQIDDIKIKIDEGNAEVQGLIEQIGTATSDTQRSALESQRALTQDRVDEWQRTLASLYETFLSNRTNKLSIVEEARPNPLPVAPHPARSAVILGVLGLLAALALSLLLEYLDNTVKADDENLLEGHVPVLARVPKLGNINDDRERLITSRDPQSRGAESFRALRTNLQFLSVDQPIKTLMITSGGPEEGKTTTAANLAMALAQADVRVILIDADLRRPQHHRIFELSNDAGLTTMLAKRTPDYDAQQCIVPITRRLSVIPSGPIPPNPSELLSSKRMELLLAALKQKADFIVIDTPPVLTVADALTLAPRCDGVLLVAEHGRTRRESLRRTAASIRQVGSRVLGLSLNRAGSSSDQYSYYNYYYTTEQPAQRRRGLRFWRPRPADEPKG